jgi:hypothetical protein
LKGNKFVSPAAQRHHAVHPVTAVRPNLDVNKKPEKFTPGTAPFAPAPNSRLPGGVAHRSPFDGVDDSTDADDTADVGEPEDSDELSDDTDIDRMRLHHHFA